MTKSLINIQKIEASEPAECTSDWDIDEHAVPSSWACQESESDARMLIHSILNNDGIPQEGLVDPDGRCMLVFCTEFGGFGYKMFYNFDDEDDMGFVRVHSVCVYHASQYDRWV